MRSRLARVGVVAAGILALLGVMTPPAHADLVFSIAFQGTATLGGPGLGYPCTNDTEPITGTTTVAPDPTYLCIGNAAGPGTTSTLISTLPLPHGEPDNVSVHFNHNRHGVNVVTDACVGTGASPLKLHTADAGTCGFTGAGHVDGHCGLSGGQVTGTATITNVDTTVLPTLDQTFHFDVHFNGIGSVLVVTGHVFNANTGQNGLIVGVVEAVPPTSVAPAPIGTPRQSCANLTANTFLIVGTAAGYTRAL